MRSHKPAIAQASLQRGSYDVTHSSYDATGISPPQASPRDPPCCCSSGSTASPSTGRQPRPLR